MGSDLHRSPDPKLDALRRLPGPQTRRGRPQADLPAPSTPRPPKRALEAFDENMGRQVPDDRRVLAGTLAVHHPVPVTARPSCAEPSTPPTASRTSTVRSARRSRHADTSPTSKPPPSSSTSRSSEPRASGTKHSTGQPHSEASRSTSETDSPNNTNKTTRPHTQKVGQPRQEPPKRARIWLASTAALDQSIFPAAFSFTNSLSCKASHTPAFCQVRSRRQHVTPEP